MTAPGLRAATRSLPTWWVVVGGVLAALVLGRYIVEGIDHGWHMIDLDVYRWGGETARTSNDLYDRTYQGFLLFTYTPFAASVFIPMSLIGGAALNISMTTLSLAALLVTAGASLRSLGYKLNTGWVGATLAIAAVGTTLEPVHETLLFGQVNIVLMALVLTDLCLPDTNRFKGIGVGIATGFKLTPAIFIPYLLLTRRWAAAGRAVAAATATVAIGFVVLPTESADFWFGRLFIDSERVGGVAYVANQSISGALIRATGTVDAAAPYWWISAVVVGGAGLWIASRISRRGPELAGILLCALTGLLISPVSWSHHWVWIVPALALGLDAAVRRTAVGWVAVGAAVVAFSAFLWGQGLIWRVPARDDLELVWNGAQSVQGNAYILIGLGLLAIAGWVSFRPRPDEAAVEPAGAADLSGSSPRR